MDDRLAGRTSRCFGRACVAMLFGLLLSSAARAQQPGVAQRPPATANRSVTQDLSYGGSFVVSVAPNLPKFTFRIIPDVQSNDQFGNATSIVRDIEVYS